MKVLILAGGLGSRLSEYTVETPKPMVPIGDMPILMHIIKRYLSYGHKDFYIATGYKSEVINKYFASLGDLKKDEKDQNLRKEFSLNLSQMGLDSYLVGYLADLFPTSHLESYFKYSAHKISNIKNANNRWEKYRAGV